MAKRKQIHKGKQYVYWVNPELETQRPAFEILEEYRRTNKNVSELVRYGIVFAHYVRTKDIEKLWDLLPEDLRRELSRETVVDRVVEKIIEVHPVIVEVKMPDYTPLPPIAPQESQAPKRPAPMVNPAEFEFEEKTDNQIGNTIDNSFSDLF